MQELSALDIHFLVEEFQNLIGARLTKAYQKPGELVLALHKEGKKFLRIMFPGMIYIASAKPEMPMNPPGFCMFLRKKIPNARLTKIEQLGMERIIIFHFEKAEKFKLVIELLAPGNAILLGNKEVEGEEKEMILHLMKPQRYKDRTVRGNTEYVPPPLQNNIKILSEEEAFKIIKDSNIMLVKALATKLSLGGYYAEHIVKLANISKEESHSEKYSDESIKKVIKKIKEFLKSKPKPKNVNKIIRFFDGNEEQNISELFDEILTVPEIKPTQKDKAKTVLNQQANQKEGFIKSAEENHKKGEAIYNHFQELQEILKLPRDQWENHPLVKNYDQKNNTLTIEVKE